MHYVELTIKSLMEMNWGSRASLFLVVFPFYENRGKQTCQMQHCKRTDAGSYLRRNSNQSVKKIYVV